MAYDDNRQEEKEGGRRGKKFGAGFKSPTGRDHDSDGDGDSRPRRFLTGTGSRRKACRFCSDSDYTLDYKVPRIIQSFMTEHGKIVPSRISGNCAAHQRALTVEVKRARNLALVGFVSPGPF